MLGEKTYKNKQGVEFQVAISFVELPEKADYWKYIARATSYAGPGLDFMIIVRKKAFPQKLSADEFVFIDPFNEIRLHLDLVDEKGTDRFWPNLTADWFVF